MGGWGAWDASWLWSLALFAVTIAIHAAGIVFIARAIGRFEDRRRRRGELGKHNTHELIGVIVAAALGLSLLHAFESMIWAFAYVRLGAFASPAEATLYSVDSMTTRGGGPGLALEPMWRMMGATEAGNGMLLFGLSTAFLFSVMQRLWAPAIREAVERRENRTS